MSLMQSGPSEARSAGLGQGWAHQHTGLQQHFTVAQAYAIANCMDVAGHGWTVCGRVTVALPCQVAQPGWLLCNQHSSGGGTEAAALKDCGTAAALL